MEILFWLSIGLIIYPYFGYPFILYLMSKFGLSKFYSTDESYQPNVSIVISISKESKDAIFEKIANTKLLSYPRQKFEVILALDNTPKPMYDLIKYQIFSNWKIVSTTTQQGKEALQRMAVEQVDPSSKIIVFTDVASMLTLDCIQLLTRHFSDKNIGVVDGESKVTSLDGKVCSEGVYLKYENKIRELESHVNSIVTAGGCLFATRLEVARAIFQRNTQSDFGSALASNLLGYRGVIDTEATATFPDLKDPSKEFNRKYRTILRGMHSLWAYRELLNPFKYGFFSVQLWSHKVLKWTVPVFMALAFFLNAIIISDPAISIYDAIFLCQLVFYFIASYGVLINSDNKYIKIIMFFVSSNTAMMFSLIDFLRGKRMDKWASSVR
jgi:hypothetical protein